MFKMKSMFAIGIAFTALLSTFNSIFDGRVVAKLPFHPIGFIQGLSHRNLVWFSVNADKCNRFRQEMILLTARSSSFIFFVQ